MTWCTIMMLCWFKWFNCIVSCGDTEHLYGSIISTGSPWNELVSCRHAALSSNRPFEDAMVDSSHHSTLNVHSFYSCGILIQLMKQLKSMVMSPLIVDKSRRQSEVVLLQDFIRLILLVRNLFCSYVILFGSICWLDMLQACFLELLFWNSQILSLSRRFGYFVLVVWALLISLCWKPWGSLCFEIFEHILGLGFSGNQSWVIPIMTCAPCNQQLLVTSLLIFGVSSSCCGDALRNNVRKMISSKGSEVHPLLHSWKWLASFVKFNFTAWI